LGTVDICKRQFDLGNQLRNLNGAITMKRLGILFFALLVLLAAGCSDLIVQSSDSNLNVEDFEALWHRVDAVYPFLEFKGIGWDSLYPVYLQHFEAARGDEALLVLNDLLAELKDAHIYYQTPGGGEVYPYYPQRYFRDVHSYSPLIVRHYFTEELTVTESGTIEYGLLPDNIAYVYLSSFQADFLLREFPSVLEHFRDSNGLIIDLRDGIGGSFQNIEAVVTRFMSQPMNKPSYYRLGELIELPQFQPRGPHIYTNPVVVLINGTTISAPEWTTEILKQLPQVTVVGDTTGGAGVASSNATIETVGEYELPSGKSVYIGTEYFEAYDGRPIEGLGVTPDIQVIQTAADIELGRDLILEQAMALHH
jgi:hypothetical protein